MAADNPPARPPGRPMDVALDAAILAAAQRHLGERGYTGMSIQGVAAAAGTSAPSLRRRYRDKLELAMASIDAMQTQSLPAKAKDPRAEILAILRNTHDTMITGNGLAILVAVVTEQTRHPELLANFRRQIVDPLRARLRHALSAGVETGQLPAASTSTPGSACSQDPFTLTTWTASDSPKTGPSAPYTSSGLPAQRGQLT